MNRLVKRKCVIAAVLVLLMLFTFGFGFAEPDIVRSGDTYAFTVCAEDTDTTGNSANNQTADAVTDTTPGDDSNGVQKKSGNAFFKWAIPISCVLSLILAVFLAIRKANKKFGDGWE